MDGARRHPRSVRRGCSIPLVFALAAHAPAGEGEKLDLKKMFQESIPRSPCISVIYRYADTMLERGRDTYGPHKSGLFLSALDRKTLSPLENRPAGPAGVLPERRPGSRRGPLVGANPQLDQNLLRLLYFLKGLSGEDRYPQAADQALSWFLKNAQSPATGLYPWGARLCWNAMADEVASASPEPAHEFCRPWILWRRSFELAPQECRRFALALRKNHLDLRSGTLRPRADFERPSSAAGRYSARHAGFCLRTWAEAYAHTKEQIFLRTIEAALEYCEERRHRDTEGGEGRKPPHGVTGHLSLAIDCDGAARKVPEPLRTRLAALAAFEDEAFLSLPHDLEREKGFAVSSAFSGGEPGSSCTSLWRSGHGRDTTAGVAVMCISRYENTGRPQYRDLIVAAADAYLRSLPEEDIDTWPMTFGHAISLELAAFRATARDEYYRRAFRLGEIAIERFFGDHPLPRASLKADHYESTTGADSLVLALVELHLTTLHITAVRAPVNTIDR